MSENGVYGDLHYGKRQKIRKMASDKLFSCFLEVFAKKLIFGPFFHNQPIKLMIPLDSPCVKTGYRLVFYNINNKKIGQNLINPL